MSAALLALQDRAPPSRLFLIACLFSAVPIWLSTYPPMVDLPLHANQVATFLRLLSGTEHFAPLLRINWFTPYWAAYAPVTLFAYFFPISIAIKLVLSCAIAATPWSAARLRALVNNDPSMDWIFLPVAYGFAFQWGFLNFIVGVPLILLFLEYSFQYFLREKISFKPLFIIVLWCHLLFLTHILILAFSLMITIPIGIYFSLNKKLLSPQTTQSTPYIQLILKTIPFLFVFPIIITWYLHTNISVPLITRPSDISPWIINIYRLIPLIGSSSGYAFSYTLGFLYTSAILLLPGAKRFKNWQSWPFIATLVIVLFCPSTIFGVNFIAERFSTFILIFYTFSFDFTKFNRSTSSYQRTLIFSTLSFLILFGNLYKIVSFKNDLSGFNLLINKIPPNQRILYFNHGEKNKNYNVPVFACIANFYFAEKGGLGDYSYSYFNSIVQYKKDAPTLLSDIQLNHSLFNWGKHNQLYDYIIIHGEPSTLSPAFLKGLKIHTHLIYSDAGWQLYAKTHENLKH